MSSVSCAPCTFILYINHFFVLLIIFPTKQGHVCVYITGVSVHMESCLSHLNRNKKPSIAHSFIFDLNLKAMS